jgi:6-pyruvoyltetrahydropterin/6-carboxytetrahydropterin synthase
VRAVCDELDEHLLLPGRHPVLTTNAQADGQLEIRYRERRYLVPSNEVLVLPITNTSAENLAAHVGGEIRSRMRERWPALRVRRLQVGIEETPGQQGVYTRED